MDVFVALLTLDSLDSSIKANCPCIAVVFPSKRKYYEEMRNALVTVDGGRNPAGGRLFLLGVRIETLLQWDVYHLQDFAGPCPLKMSFAH